MEGGSPPLRVKARLGVTWGGWDGPPGFLRRVLCSNQEHLIARPLCVGEAAGGDVGQRAQSEIAPCGSGLDLLGLAQVTAPALGDSPDWPGGGRPDGGSPSGPHQRSRWLETEGIACPGL